MKRALQVAFLWRKWVMSHIPLNRVSFLLLSIAFMLQKSPWCSFVKIILLNQMWKYHYFFMVIIQNPLEESHFLCVEGNEDDANFKILPAALGGETWRAARRSNTSDKRELNIKPVNMIRFSVLCSDEALSSVKRMNTQTEEQLYAVWSVYWTSLWIVLRGFWFRVSSLLNL